VSDSKDFWRRVAEGLQNTPFTRPVQRVDPDQVMRLPVEPDRGPVYIGTHLLRRSYNNLQDMLIEGNLTLEQFHVMLGQDGVQAKLGAAARRTARTLLDAGVIEAGIAGHAAMSVAEALLTELDVDTGANTRLALSAAFGALTVLELQALLQAHEPVPMA
jgi:hypothetical protein